jgi:hypothetical protein
MFFKCNIHREEKVPSESSKVSSIFQNEGVRLTSQVLAKHTFHTSPLRLLIKHARFFLVIPNPPPCHTQSRHILSAESKSIIHHITFCHVTTFVHT